MADPDKRIQRIKPVTGFVPTIKLNPNRVRDRRQAEPLSPVELAASTLSVGTRMLKLKPVRTRTQGLKMLSRMNKRLPAIRVANRFRSRLTSGGMGGRTARRSRGRGGSTARTM